MDTFRTLTVILKCVESLYIQVFKILIRELRRYGKAD